MTLENILKMSDTEILNSLEATLKTHYKNVVVKGDRYIYAEGTVPHCLVAHIDTVRRKGVDLTQNYNIIRNNKGILGADDRAGVYVILELLKESVGLGLPHVLFTNYEETGGKGASEFCADFKELPGVNLFVEYDRKGANEFVDYSYCPKEVHEYMKGFGYREEHGSFSDISILCDHFLIPGINLSCGYYNAHTEKEELHVDEVEMAINRGMLMLDNPIDQLYPLEDLSFKYGLGRGWGDFLDSPKKVSIKKYKKEKKKKFKDVLDLMETSTVKPDFDPRSVEMSNELRDLLDYLTYGEFTCTECGLDVFSCEIDGNCGSTKEAIDWSGGTAEYNEYLDICDMLKQEEAGKDFLYGV